MKDWKSCERRIATLLGGQRVPVSGRGRGDSPDIWHHHLSIEVKSRRRIPDWIEAAVRQAEDCAKDGQLSVAILHADGARYLDALVVMRLEDFAKHL